MRALLILPLFLIPIICNCQFLETKVTILEEKSYSVKTWGGEARELQVSLIHMTGDVVDTFALISLDETRKVVTGYSSGIGVSSSGNFAVGSSTQRQIVQSGGVRKLRRQDLLNLMDWINQTYVLSRVDPPTSTTWTLQIDEGFQMSFIYDPKSVSKWYVLLGIDEGSFRMTMENAKELLIQFREMRNRLQTGNLEP